MTQRTARILLLALIVVLAGGVPTFAGEAVIVESVPVGGTTHLLVYAPGDADASRIKIALPGIVTTYETLWSASPNTPMAFRMLIDSGLEPALGEELSETAFESVALPLPSAPEEWQGEAESSETDVCQIHVLDAQALGQLKRLEFELALAAARCYLLYNVPAAPEDWWFEGLAHWMAIQVYAPPGPVLAELQDEYEEGYNGNLLNSGSEAMYFWEFLLAGMAPQSQQNPLPTDLPTLTGSFSNMAKTFLWFTPELFYAYGEVAASDLLPWQPAAEELAEETDLSQGLPGDVELDLEENSIYLTQVTLPTLEEGQGVSITGANLADSGTMVGIGSEGAFLPMAEGTPAELCGEEVTEFTVVAGRAMPADPDSIPLEGLSLSVELKDPCEEPCVEGTWQGTLVETLEEFRTFSFQVVIDSTSSDGTFTGRTVAINPNDQYTQLLTISGTCDGVNIEFQDEEGRLYSGVVQGNQITGQVVWDCDGCITWGEFTVSR